MFQESARVMERRRTSLSGCTRRDPKQRRGEKRVEELLRAAVAEFSRVGYEAATMSAIADRAGAPIGSLYQFFPNKQAVARALRTNHVEDVERQWAGLEARTAEEFVSRFVDLMVTFVESHPAFLPLQDAPSSTQPVGPRNRLRTRLEEMLRGLQTPPRPGTEARLAEVVLVVNKALMGLYARSAPEDRAWVAAEYRRLLTEYLSGRAEGPARARGRARAAGGVRGSSR